MDDKLITVISEDGTEEVCEILFTYHSEEFNRNYVVFKTSNDNEISAAAYEEAQSEEGVLKMIETEEEWELIEDLVDQFFANQEECGCEEDSDEGCECEEGCSCKH